MEMVQISGYLISVAAVWALTQKSGDAEFGRGVLQKPKPCEHRGQIDYGKQGKTPNPT